MIGLSELDEFFRAIGVKGEIMELSEFGMAFQRDGAKG